MKKLYAGLFALFAVFNFAHANPGDTTVIQAHDHTQLSWYGDYDSTVAFPDGSTSYRKIIMDFTLGKYNCGGIYNPNNPGEGSGRTGWCSDWDYDIEVYLCTTTDTVELGRLITPYANSTMPRTPLTWSHSYLFDVTDYYPLLKNNATIRIGYKGYSGGFTGTVRFLMIEGTPPRNVVDIKTLWIKSSDFGDAANPISNNITQKTVTFPSNAVYGEERVYITGHGNDDAGCSEFCKKYYQFKVNGTMVEQTDIWRDDCGSNFLYPQSGTWVFDRGNWCPGDLVRMNRHKVPASITPGSSFTTDISFPNYTGTVSPNRSRASYKVSGTMVFYGEYNHSLDAGIESIISPTNEETYIRSNPICGAPQIMVKNFGSTTVTGIAFEYGIEGQTLSTYTWTGSLASMASAQVSLPALSDFNTVSGSSNKFVVRITKVNGSTDQDMYNNEMKSTFSAASIWNGGHYAINLKLSAPLQGYENKTIWTITDVAGNIIRQRQGTSSTAPYIDTVDLPNGCYKLNVDASFMGYGLRNPYVWAPSDAGYFRVFNMTGGTQIQISKNSLGTSTYQGNLESYFGNGFDEYFRVANSSVTSINDPNVSAYSLNIYPNPARDLLHVDVYGLISKEAKVTLVNMLGQVVYTQQTRNKQITIITGHLTPGVYTLIYNTGDTQKLEKIVINR